MIEIKIFKLGKLETNCYLVLNKPENRGILIDPGGEISSFEEKVSSLYTIDYILLTHGHFDHILNAAKYREITGAKIVISKMDCEFTTNNNLNLSRKFLRHNTLKGFVADILVKDGDIILFLDHEIKVISTPGHTQGSVCYMLDNYIFSGDTLFYRDCGYTKFPTGNKEDMQNSLKKLYNLENDYKIYPGHSQSTLLSEERNNKTGLEK